MDSGLFSRALAQHCADVVHQRALAAVERSGGDDPCTARGVSFVDALHEAVGMTVRLSPGTAACEDLSCCSFGCTLTGIFCCDSQSHKGTSTAVLVGLDAADDCTPQRTTQAPVEDDGAPTSRLVVANLGDSGAVVVRRAPAGEGDVEPLGGGGMVWKPLLRTKEQVHGWNTPLQVGTSGDDPRKADVWCVDGVRHGDIVLACSDGVFDNIWLRDLLLYIGGRGSALHALATDSPDDPAALETVEAEMRALALAVASSASKIGTNPKADTPFGGGGKEDDATVVAGMVRTH